MHGSIGVGIGATAAKLFRIIPNGAYTQDYIENKKNRGEYTRKPNVMFRPLVIISSAFFNVGVFFFLWLLLLLFCICTIVRSLYEQIYPFLLVRAQFDSLFLAGFSCRPGPCT